jgi:hypothetical protein
MYARVAFLGVALLVAAPPAQARELKAEEARRFVAGKLFAYTCFEGTRGAGRIYSDGSVQGSVQFRGAGPVHYVRLPANTVQMRGESVCASVKGLPFEPCFNVVQTDQQSFRGSLSGLSFAYCQFTRRGGRVDVARSSSKPWTLRSSISATGAMTTGSTVAAGE